MKRLGYELLASESRWMDRITNKEAIVDAKLQVQQKKAYGLKTWALAASCALNLVLATVLVAAFAQTGPANPVFPQALYCTHG
jgi:hypothetical protein